MKSQGTTPQEAFSKVFLAVVLTPTKNQQVATVCIENIGGKRKTCNYYTAQSKTQTIQVRVRWWEYP